MHSIIYSIYKAYFDPKNHTILKFMQAKALGFEIYHNL